MDENIRDEELQLNTEVVNETMNENVRKYDLEKYSALNCMDIFMDLSDDRRFVEHFKTGLTAVDEVTSGGFEIGFGIINGVSGSGKTTICNQIAYNMSDNGQPVIIFSLEMEKNALLAKAVSMQSFIDGGTLFTANEILSKDLAIYKSEDTFLEYKNVAFHCAEAMKNVVIVDRNTLGKSINSDIIIDFVNDYIKQTGKRPVVIVDYLQRLAPNTGLHKSSSKMDIIDDNTETLWNYAHERKLCIVAISSLNRASYKDGATLEGNKGSGNIEYSSDFGLGIQFQGFDQPDFNFNYAKAQNPRKVEIVVLKQRLGSGGLAIPYIYYPAYNVFVEQNGSLDNDEDYIPTSSVEQSQILSNLTNITYTNQSQVQSSIHEDIEVIKTVEPLNNEPIVEEVTKTVIDEVINEDASKKATLSESFSEADIFSDISSNHNPNVNITVIDF